jgi:hypothetical protein
MMAGSSRFSYPEIPDNCLRRQKLQHPAQHYSLPAIIAVGYKVNSERAVQFRKWATGIIDQFTI